MIKHFAFVLLLILCLSVVLPAQAAVCRNYDNHLICILSIKRSAKNYWEYRAAISFDAIKTPIEVYNCRSRVKIQQDGTVLPFKDNDPGKLICSFFPKSS